MLTSLYLLIVFKYKKWLIGIKEESMFSMNHAALLTLSFIWENDPVSRRTY